MVQYFICRPCCWQGLRPTLARKIWGSVSREFSANWHHHKNRGCCLIPALSWTTSWTCHCGPFLFYHILGTFKSKEEGKVKDREIHQCWSSAELRSVVDVCVPITQRRYTKALLSQIAVVQYLPGRLSCSPCALRVVPCGWRSMGGSGSNKGVSQPCFLQLSLLASINSSPESNSVCSYIERMIIRNDRYQENYFNWYAGFARSFNPFICYHWTCHGKRHENNRFSLVAHPRQKTSSRVPASNYLEGLHRMLAQWKKNGTLSTTSLAPSRSFTHSLHP